MFVTESEFIETAREYGAEKAASDLIQAPSYTMGFGLTGRNAETARAAMRLSFLAKMKLPPSSILSTA